MKQLLDYAFRGGGTLVITDNTGMYNDWREQRHKNPFLPAPPRGQGTHLSFTSPKSRVPTRWQKRPMPRTPNPALSLNDSPRMSPAQWVLPKNHQQMYDAIVTNLPSGTSLSLISGAPLTTTAELYVRPETHETIVHFVNFDRKHPLPPFAVTVKKQFTGPVKTVRLFSPDTDDPIVLPFQESDGKITFTVPSMRIYSMIVIS